MFNVCHNYKFVVILDNHLLSLFLSPFLAFLCVASEKESALQPFQLLTPVSIPEACGYGGGMWTRRTNHKFMITSHLLVGLCLEGVAVTEFVSFIHGSSISPSSLPTSPFPVCSISKLFP